MRGNTRQYNELKRRIDYLLNNHLPTSTPSGQYTKKQMDEIRSFLLLSHAEFEYYFEEVSEQIARRALRKWVANHNYKSKVLLYLATFTESTEKIKQASTSEDKIKAIVGQYLITLKKNNGIKEENILKILCPIGIEQTQIDNFWLSTITSYGSSRGMVAHTSARTQTLKDPKDIISDVNYLMTEISKIDILLKSLS